MNYPKARAGRGLGWLLLVLVLVNFASSVGLVFASPAVRATMITNGTLWENGLPVALPGARWPQLESVFLSRPGAEWTYSHHAHLIFFDGRFFAMWSNGRKTEDKPGQRVMISSATDFGQWTPPYPLVDTMKDANGIEQTLTASGFYQHTGTLVAYVQSCGPRYGQNKVIEALTTQDGQNWSEPRPIGLAIAPPNFGPEPLASGRLIISGNTAYPWTDDLSGLSGWHMAGINSDTSPGRPCEASFFQTDDGVIHMFLRNGYQPLPHRLWLTESRDNGLTWTAAVPTSFSDATSKFHFGRLPDGRFYYIGNPLWHRTPLVLSLSRDGVHFDEHFILAEADRGIPRDQRHQSDGYGYPAYPDSIIHDGCLYIIFSRDKNKIEVERVALNQL